MSQIREPSHDPFKLFVVSADKLRNVFLVVMKSALLISVITSIALFLYSSFYNQPSWFRSADCTRNSVHPGQNNSETHEPTNISHIVFGIGGSVNSWKDRSHYSELWWRPNVTRGYIWLDEKPASWPKTSPPFRVSEDWSRFRYSSSPNSVRIARIVLETFRLGLPNVRWFVMGDDDTVFFTDNLVSVLAKYDHHLMYYVGANSESVEQDVMHSYEMAFGGGGFAISYPLAAELAKVLDGCVYRYYTFYGSDQKIAACMNEIGVSLTRERGFHQFDIRGDAYGILAAHPVAPLVSLHHIDFIEPLFPNQTRHDSLKNLVRAHRVDPAGTMQQSICYDHNRNWSISVSWGYTARIYPSLLTAKDLTTPVSTFRTWRTWASGPFTFNTRPMKNDPSEKPVIYFLDRVGKVTKGETITEYKRFGARTGNVDNLSALPVTRMAVFAMKMDSTYWNKAPRRRCCEIIDQRSISKGTLQIRIRNCKPGETVTM